MISDYDITTLNNKELSVYRNKFKHFGMRLYERYGIMITFEQYVTLSKLPYINKGRTHKDTFGELSIVGNLYINGVEVKVAKSIKGIRPLITVM
jgi:hypothetical protein